MIPEAALWTDVELRLLKVVLALWAPADEESGSVAAFDAELEK